MVAGGSCGTSGVIPLKHVQGQLPILTRRRKKGTFVGNTLVEKVPILSEPSWYMLVVVNWIEDGRVREHALVLLVAHTPLGRKKKDVGEEKGGRKVCVCEREATRICEGGEKGGDERRAEE